MDALSIVLIAVCGVLLVMVVLLVIYVVRLQKKATEQATRTKEIIDALASANDTLDEAKVTLGEIKSSQIASTAAEQTRFESITRGFDESANKLETLRSETREQMDGFRKDTTEQMDGFRRDTSDQLNKNREGIEQRLDRVRETVDKQLGDIRQDNTQQLEKMRNTVDEKLTQTLNDRLTTSFKTVSDQLESVYKGLGDMKSVASGVGDLKKVLSGVKTRGILGEVQLGAILADILSPEQYDTNVATKPNSSERVEFAVKIPMAEGGFVYLPIDSKFPGDAYEHLVDATEDGDKDAIEAARKALVTQIKNEAKDISSKYISVPETTNFGIMFLPFEGLYAEVVGQPGLISTLAHDHHVNVAGPSTMAAILNSLEMAYQTLNLQKRTDEVLQVLQAVKAELPKYQAALRKAQKQINTAGETVETLITTRTNVMERKLKSIDAMEDADAAERLLSDGTNGDEAIEADEVE